MSLNKQVRSIVAAAVGASALVAIAASAQANGSPRYKDAPVEPVRTWSGIYIGGHIGHHDVDTAGIWDGAGATPHSVFGDFDLDGWNGGIQGGIDVQWRHWVIGVRGDYTWADQSDSFVDGEGDLSALSLDNFATLRARLGVAATVLNGRPLLVYTTLGAAWGELNWSVENGAGSGKIDETGWAYGGGTEVKLTKRISFNTEYLVLDFDETVDLSRGIPDSDQGDFVKLDKIHTFRAGLNIRFGVCGAKVC